jgi:hypothetical protein
MCFYRPLNKTNEWGPWPQRGAEESGVEKQLPRVSLEAQHHCLVSSSGNLGMHAPTHMGMDPFLASLPSLGLCGFLERETSGARGGPDFWGQRFLLILCVSGARMGRIHIGLSLDRTH